MTYQVIEAGWVFEVEAPDHCRIERKANGKPVLVVPAGDQFETLEPHAVVRAAKDNLLGLTCNRSWRVDTGGRPLDPSLAIREFAVNT